MIQINLHKYGMVVRSLAAYLLCKGDILEGIREERATGRKV